MADDVQTVIVDGTPSAISDQVLTYIGEDL